MQFSHSTSLIVSEEIKCCRHWSREIGRPWEQTQVKLKKQMNNTEVIKYDTIKICVLLAVLLTHWGRGMDKERLSNESYRTGLYKRKHTQSIIFGKQNKTKVTSYLLTCPKTNSLVFHNACTTCCSLNDHEKDVETSKDLVLDEEELPNRKKQTHNEI